MIARELKIFLTAVRFFTRIPVPRSIGYSENMLNHSMRYFPLMGWIVGGIAALVFYGCTYLFPMPVRIILSMVATLLMTGAFHEDGFADMCDGFGGGWNKEQILQIMKDSRIGSFGAIGIVMILLSKFILLTTILPAYVPFVLIAGHSISRFAAAVFVYTHKYVGDEEQSKFKPLGNSITPPELLVAAIFGFLPILWMHSWYCFLLPLPVILTYWLLARFFTKRIGGFTGDCLGATQQITEVVFYLSFVGMIKSGF
jgi:adenosylcobinamide-GDP ribazoletransferase